MSLTGCLDSPIVVADAHEFRPKPKGVNEVFP